MEEYLAQITSIKYLTLEVVEITALLIAPDEVTFTAGQGMQLKVEGQPFNFVITNTPNENNKNLVFCLRINKDSPLREYVQKLAVGQQITLDGPVDVFKIDGTSRLGMILFAENTGIAVYCAALPELLIKNPDKKIKLIFQVRTEEDIFYFAQFRKLANLHPNFTFTPMVVSPFSHWPGEVGTAATFVKVSGQYYIDDDVYISGHKNFVDSVGDEWNRIQLGKKNVFKYIVPEAL